MTPEAPPRSRKAILALTVVGALLAVMAAASYAMRGPDRPAASLPETPVAPPAPSPEPAPSPAPSPSPPVAQPLVQQVLAPPPGANPAPAPRPPSERHHEGNGDFPTVERRPRAVRPAASTASAGPPLDLSGIYQGVRPRMSDFHRCVQPAGGNVQFTMDIDHGGAARNVSVTSPPADSPQGRCVTRVVRGLRYPAGRPTPNARVMFTP